MDPPASAVPPPPIPAHPHAGGKKSRHDPTHRGVADAESSHTSPTGGKKRRHRSSSVPEKSRSSNSVPSDDGGTGPWIRVTAGGKRGSVHRDPVAVAAAVARRASGWTKQRALRQPAAPEPARELHVPRRMFGHHGVKVKLSHSFSQSSDDSQPHGADTALSSKQRRRRSRQRSRGSRANSAGASHDDSAVVISSAASSSRGGSDQDGPVIVTPGQLSTESAGHPAVALSVPSPSTRSLARGQPIQLKPLVKCTDGLRTTTRSLRDILHAASGDGDDVYSLEADTPLVRPSDPQHVVPPMMLTAALAPPRLPRCNSEGRGSMDELTVPRHAFTVEGIATPNTFYAMPHHPMPPPLPHEQTYQDILAGFNPENQTFAWHGNPAASSAFAEQLMALCGTVTSVFRQQPLLRQLDAPAYVLGDIHGNFSDLSFFLRNFLVLNDINLTPGCQILCLGDYVDRGPHSVECVALLFALAMEAPDRVVLLRGNHEDRVVCGDRRIYGEECFWSQCCRRFGTVTGTRVFHCVTRVFRHLPLACELNLPHPHSTKILCTHGGFPRFNIHDRSSFERIKLLQRDDFPRFLTLFPNNPLAQDDSGSDTEELPDFVEAAWFTAFDLLWSDPTTDEDDQTVDENGFSCNARGMNVMSFSQKAVEHYLHATNYAMLFRAHQEKRFGLRLSKSSKVLTLFSSSNYQGHGNSAGCAIVSAQGSVQLIVKH